LYGPDAAGVLAAVLAGAADPGGPADGETPEARRARLERLPMNANAIWRVAGAPLIAVRSDDYGVPGYELFGGQTGVRPGSPPASADLPAFSLLEALRSHGAADVSPETAHVCRVEAGRPEFGIDMDEHTIPLEAGIEERAISMTKGCYVGQEVIVRVLHRGHGRVARRLVGFVGDPGGPLPAGAQRLFAAGEGGREIGIVTSAVESPRLGRPIGLGYVHRDFTAPGTLLQASAGEGMAAAKLTVAAVPFTASAG
jgi:folate-binding protein YgfZ